jgi:hypothetical protein
MIPHSAMPIAIIAVSAALVVLLDVALLGAMLKDA